MRKLVFYVGESERRTLEAKKGELFLSRAKQMPERRREGDSRDLIS